MSMILIRSSMTVSILAPDKPLPLVGVTMADSTTVIEGSATVGFNDPAGIKVYDSMSGETVIVTDQHHNQVVQLRNMDSILKNASVLVDLASVNDNFNKPTDVFLDTNHLRNNLYVVDSSNDCVWLFSSTQSLSPQPTVAAGVLNSPGSTVYKLDTPRGAWVDSQENLYVLDTKNHRVILWAAHATSGVMIAGSGSGGSSSWNLKNPLGLFFDEAHSHLYVADTDNHRIQLFIMIGTPPFEGITVAGGNGAGADADQLEKPSSLWVSSRTGFIYVSDTRNNRVQRWRRNETSSVTVAGDSSGSAGSDDMRLDTPAGLVVNRMESRLFVCDANNRRIQRFDLF
jgi:hypothetical protein